MFHMWDVSSGMGWWMAFGGIWILLFWGGIIALIVWGISKLAGNTGNNSTSSKYNPLDIARERYARGDISKEEYIQIKRDVS